MARSIPVPKRSHSRVSLARTRFVRLPGSNSVRPLALPVGEPEGLTAATSVGILGGPGTTITMIPADLTIGPYAEISGFVIVSIDAGVYS